MQKIVFLCLLLLPLTAFSQERPTIVLGTVGQGSNERINLVEGQLLDEKPGWFIELSQKAANQCNADIDFTFMPWNRVLKQIEKGALDGGFNSSYKPERTAFGVYPLTNGEPDKARASKYYGYYAYGRLDAGSLGDLKGVRVVAERNASIQPELKKRGVIVQEVASYTSMLKMVAGKRVELAVGIGGNLDLILKRNKELSKKVTKLKPALTKKVGYVMFSKQFYKKHPKLAECFWSTSASLRKTGWYMDLRERYWQQD